MLKIENTTNVCDICTSNPSTVYCRADLAYLCSSCDARIHAANQVAARHERVPVQTSSGAELLSYKEENESFYDDDETASWLFGGGDVDEYLDLDDYNSCQFSGEYEHHQQYYSVPQKSYGFEMNYHNAKDEVEQHVFDEASNTGYNCSVSMSHSVSLSQMDVGVVPESTISESSISHHNRPPKGITELFSGNPIPIPTQLTPMDREARVLRYREKKKARKFEKTIRYASRKAYAETRPRIKGRFAKRTDSESEVDQMFSSSMMAESVYGVVPTF